MLRRVKEPAPTYLGMPVTLEMVVAWMVTIEARLDRLEGRQASRDRRGIEASLADLAKAAGFQLPPRVG
jgi:hypothetical protein